MESMDENAALFLSLIRIGIGKAHPKLTDFTGFPREICWSDIQNMAAKHGLSAIVLDGIEKVRRTRDDVRFDSLQEKILMAQWIGEVSQFYEQRYELYLQAISSLAAFYNNHSYKMMVLKGYACSLDWPKPEHRPCGDIDIWQFGLQKDADAVLSREKGIKIDYSHHHHTVFNWHDFMVENHYDFINTHRHKSHRGLEKVFKELGGNDTYSIELYGNKVYLPSPNLHALFLVRHALNHFASIGISFRQVLDWAFFVEQHGKDINWEWLNDMLENYNMKNFYCCMNAICVENLGFDASIFHGIQFNPVLKEKVLRDIMYFGYSFEDSPSVIRKYAYMFQRWRGNIWKQKLCYKETIWSMFWNGIWSHLLKPNSN